MYRRLEWKVFNKWPLSDMYKYICLLEIVILRKKYKYTFMAMYVMYINLYACICIRGGRKRETAVYIYTFPM